MDDETKKLAKEYAPTNWDQMWKAIGTSAFNNYQLEQLDVLMKENARYREALDNIVLHGTCAENCGYQVDQARQALKGD